MRKLMYARIGVPCWSALHIYKELLRLNADLSLFQAQGLNEVQRAIDTVFMPVEGGGF
jgi:hypothetical protein